MAKVDPKSMLAGLSGKVGDLVFSTGRNGTFVRAAPSGPGSRKNRPSTLQLEMRARFALASQFVTRAGKVIRLGCGDHTGSPHGLAIKNLIKDAIEGTGPNLSINFSKVMVSQGRLSKPDNPVLQLLSNRRLEFSWSNRIRKKTAEMVLALFSPVNHQWETEVCVLNFRKSLFFNVPVALGELLEAYVFMRYSDGSKASDSIYLGSVVLDK